MQERRVTIDRENLPDGVTIREALLREQYRGGQTFYVCPRIEDLAQIAVELRELVPEIRMAMAHGKLSPTAIENTMQDFVDGKFDVLLSTNIVESGLDISNANTMVIHRADMFGLAQLYQLRGRIGRGKTRAYAYLTVPPGRALNEAASKRLEVMQTLDTLGAGFQLASHDLDIRGAGNLLGEEQSGHIREVGIELYQQLLEEAVEAARGQAREAERADWSPQLNLGIPVLLMSARTGLGIGRLRELMSRSSSILRDASYASAPPAGSRGQVLLTFLEAQQQFVARETNRPNLPRGESQAGNELFSRLGSIGDNIAATAGNDAATTAIEREALRQAFLDIRRFARRRHLTIATPFWGQTPDSSNPNGIFFAGSDRYRDIVEQVCRARGLEMLDRKVGLEIGRDRWRDLASCSVGIFDLTVPRGRDLAAVCYDLGLSQGLGISPIVLSLPNLKVPFDVNVYEYRLDGAHDEDIVADALDDAQCAPPSSTAGSSIALTIDEVRRRAALVDTEGTDAVLQQQTLDALSRTDDAIEVARLIAYLPKNDPISLLLPAWPGGYPAPPKTRCFHVMPFGKRWSDAAMRAVESVCDDAKAKYVRGDTIADPDIIESIWNEITAATHVIVDVTSFNANVAMELGLAHALGRKVLLVAQGSGVEKRLWPSISKLRVEPYAVQPDMDSLRQCTRQFLSNRTFASSDRQILRASAGARPKR
jgi:hypothetical protein